MAVADEAPVVWRPLPDIANRLLETFSWHWTPTASDCAPPPTSPVAIRGDDGAENVGAARATDFADGCLRLEGGRSAFERLYSIGERIGQGAFGVVYACQRQRERLGHFSKRKAGLEEPLCVKVVPTQGRRAARVAQIDEEQRTELLLQCLRMDHPNIAKYHRFVQTEEALYTVMQRCCGPDLVDFVKEAPEERLPITTIRDLAGQIFAAVAEVHSHGLMHRDIKPENFRFRDKTSGVLQLLDFGFAKPTSGSPAQHSVTGTLLYAAPEVFDGVYCNKCDLWSAGIVLFQLFVGDPPYQTADVQILRSLHRDPVLSGDALFRGAAKRLVPCGARELVKGLLNVNPTERLSAAEASESSWLVVGEDSDGLGDSAIKSTLARCSSAISNQGDNNTDMKRSYFVWDLAAAIANSDEETDEY